MKARKKRKKNDSCQDEASDEDDVENDQSYFRGKQDLKYANLEWRDIKQTTLGRKIDEKIKMLLQDRRNLTRRIETILTQNRISLDR